MAWSGHLTIATVRSQILRALRTNRPVYPASVHTRVIVKSSTSHSAAVMLNVAVLQGGCDRDRQQQPVGVDRNVPIAALDLHPAVVPAERYRRRGRSGVDHGRGLH